MVYPSVTRLLLLVLGLCVLCCGDLFSQNRPLERAEREREAILDDDPLRQSRGSVRDQREHDSVGDTTPLGVDFVSIELISHHDKATMSASPGVEALVIDPELPAPEDLTAILKSYLGREVSMAALGDLGRDIVVAWRESDYPLVDVYFPEQNITKGRIQVVVREALLGNRSVKGSVITKEDYVLQQFRLHPGDRVNNRILSADLDWLNENPIREISVVYEKGEEDGTTDIVLEVEERNQITAYAGFANTGLDSIGRNQFSFGVNLGNPFGREHAFGYDLGADETFEFLEAHSLFYQAFLPWRHTLRLSGSYVLSEARDGGEVGVKGVSKQLTAAYRIPLDRPEFNRSWRHHVTFAFDYKSTDTGLIFGGADLLGSQIQVGQFRGTYEFAFPDRYGYTRVTAGIIGSPGDLFEYNTDASFQAARSGATADYWYGFGKIDRTTKLPHDFTFRMRASGKVSSDRLPATEQILGGGYVTVRGFDESIIRGDSGFLGSAELVSPPFELFGSLEDTWNLFAFLDTAAFDISQPRPGESSPALTGGGLGVTGRLGNYGTIRASYGWALSSYGVSPLPVNDGKFHFGLTVIY